MRGEDRVAFHVFKRCLDVMVSALALLVLLPFLAVVATAVRLSSPGPAIFRQFRIGRHCRPFRMLKFRTMRLGAHEAGPLVTTAGDERVTPLGRLLRASKVDELPQLWNVLRGDMSLVGPRPQTRQYFERYRDDYAEILAVVRPGITDYAAIEYRDEEGVLKRHADPEREYIRQVIPQKLRLYRLYVERRSVATDLYILYRTAAVLFARGRPDPGPAMHAAPVREASVEASSIEVP